MKNKMPGSISVISKSIPIKVTPVKSDSVPVITEKKILHQLRKIIYGEAIFGINRLYLLNHSRIIQLLTHLLSVHMMAVVIYSAVQTYSSSASYTVIVDTTCIEYLCLVITCMMTSKSSVKSIFTDLATFDDGMNLSEDLDVTTPSNRGWVWISLGILYSIFELVTLTIRTKEIDTRFLLIYITMIAHDFENVFFDSLLKMIMIRVYVIKAHIVKTFSMSRYPKKELSKIEMLSKRAELDISSLHRNYELLHKCSEHLNSLMSLPMMVMMFCSGLTTTMLLRTIFKSLQGITDKEYDINMIAYASSRCLRYAFVVVIPCYISSVTTNQVTQIRTMLHDAMNHANIGKIDRRRIKAFFQLTRENEFAYALWGVIRLNMSLPLSYLSLCTTYLVIIIQFSKFID